MQFTLNHCTETISHDSHRHRGVPMAFLLSLIDKWLPAGHQTITPGEISPNSGPIDVQM